MRRLAAVWALLPLLLFLSPAAEFSESFHSPASENWRTFGNGALFTQANGALHVRWDSDEPNSYFYYRLPATLSKKDDFSVAIQVTVQEIGIEFSGPFAFEIAFGFFNEASATNSAFIRGTGRHSPNLVEWDYFPDTGFGATASRAIASTNSNFVVANDFPLELTPGAYEITLAYTGKDRTLRAGISQDGQTLGALKPLVLPASFSDFAVDAFGIMNYHDGSSHGRLTASAIVDDVILNWTAHELRIAGAFAHDAWEVSFEGRGGERYQLERAETLGLWAPVGEALPGADQTITLRDFMPPADGAFYRVRVIP